MPEGENSTENFTGVLELRGRPYSIAGANDYNYNGIWCGTSVRNENTYDASATQPFGFEVIRTYARLNFYNETALENNTIRCQNDVGIWLVIDNGARAQWEQFNDYIYFFDNIRWGLPAANPGESYIGYWNGTQHDTDLGKATNALGYNINLSNRSIYSINWDYAPEDGNGDDPNTNQVGFRITHDGDFIKLWINPDPDNNTAGYPNEWCLVKTVDVTWSQNMKIMLGHNMRQRDLRRQEADFDNLLIRSAADVSEASISPATVEVKPTTQTLTYCISNHIVSSNAGVNVIKITKPSICEWSSNPVSDITVMDYYANNTIQTLKSIADFSTWGFTNQQVMIRTNGNDITLFLGSQITNRTAPEKGKIYIRFNFIINSPFTSADFTSTVEAVQFENMGAASGKWDKDSTCGPQKTTGTVQITPEKSDAVGFASITPNQIIQGSASYSFTYYIEGGGTAANNYDIKKAVIMIPPVFTINSNSISSYKISDESTYIKVTNIPALAGPGTNFIYLDYEGDGKYIAAGGGVDTVTFTIKGDSQKGNHVWYSRVDDNVIDGTSTLTSTNSSNPRQDINVLGAPPNAAGGITKPVNADPVVLFNTITINTLEYTIENRAPAAEADNKIQMAVITIPAVFTNINVIGSSKISNTYIKFHQGSAGNVSIVTLFYAQGNGPIFPNNDKDIITFRVFHDRPGNSGTTNISFSAVVDNSNGTGIQPLSAGMITNMTITDPYPIGSVSITPDDGIVYTSEVTNNFTHKLYNTAPSGDIKFAWITLPTNYFTLITNISSSRIANNWIQKQGPDKIFFDYSAGGGNNPIDIGQLDTITFTLIDKYTNIAVADSVVITSRVGNLTKTNDTSDKDPVLGLTRTVTFTPQDARVQSYVSNNYVLTEVTVSTLYYVFRNNGNPGNKVSYAEAAFSAGGLSITKATSTKSGVWNIGGLTFSKAGLDLNGGESDVVKLVLSDSITIEDTRTLIPRVTINTSTLITPELPSGKVNTVLFRTPPPEARVTLTPLYMFISSNAITNNYSYTFYNDGEGSNELEQAVIYLPSALLGKVTGIYSSWLGGSTYITNKSDRIVIGYAQATKTLDAKTNDIIQLVVTNSLISNQSLYWKSGVANNDGKGIYTNTGILTGGRKTIQVIEHGYSSISSSTTIFDSTVTNDFRYRLTNPTRGSNVVSARIYIPTTIFTVITNTITSENKGGSASISVINNYIEIDYRANTLKPTENDVISMKIVDGIVKNTNSTLWEAKVQYLTNDSYYYTSGDISKKTLRIIHTPALAEAYILPNTISTVADSNIFTYYIKNTGTGVSNDIVSCRIKIPAGFTKATNIQSALITTDNLYATQVGSNIVLNYAGDGSMIPSQTFETVTFMAYDAIAVESSYVWTSEVDNLSPAVNYRPASVYGAQSQTVNSVIPGFVARGFINPTNAVSTETNRHSFNVIIENVGQTGNNIDMADIYLPTSAFTTNGVIVSSSIINATNISVIASNIIRLDYLAEGRSITPLSSDTINIQIYDTMTTGTQTVAWDMKTKFNTSPGFADTSITPGQSKKVHMIMPDVSAEGELITGSIAFSDTNTSRNFTYQVRNTGTGNNNIYYAEITLPSTFTNCTVNALSSVIANDAANIEELIVNGTNWVIRLKYENESYLTSGQTDDVTVTLNNFLFPTEVFGLRFKCEARNRASTPPPLTSVDVGEKLNIVNPSPWQCDAYLEQDSQFIYTLDKSADLSFRIDNKSGIHGIKKAVIAFDTNIFTNVRVTSRLVSGASISTTLTNIVLDYAGGVFTKVGTGQNYYDVLKIKFNYNLSMPTSRTLACRITFEDNYEFNAPAGSETQVLGVQYAYWGKIVGLIKPNENVNLNIYPAGQSKGTTNYLGQTAFLSTVQSSSDAAIYSIDRLPPGNYDVECQKTGFRNDRYLVNIAVASNRITYADLIILKNNKIEANSTIERQIYCYDDGGNSYVSFAVGSVLEDFYLDIYKKAISDAQVAAISKNSSIINPTAGPDMKVFDFELQNIKAADADEMELDKSVTLVLYYSDAELAAQGWSEDSLAIYYWKHSTGEWIRLGGEIDKAKNTVTVKVAYLHTTYALFGATPVNYTKIFGDLKAWPLAFSPGRGGDTFGKFKVTFIFKSPVDEYRFKVYDLMGRVIYEKIFNSGPYYQGEAPWSGKDNEGVISKSGVYIYQIEVGQEYYRGKVMILK